MLFQKLLIMVLVHLVFSSTELRVTKNNNVIIRRLR